MQHAKHLQAVLVVASETKAPVAYPQAVLGRIDTNETHYVALSSLRELLYCFNHTASHESVESLQISPSLRLPVNLSADS